MKKMTIALFTAAAMGASSFAVAQTGPTISGRINLHVSNVDGESVQFKEGNGDRVEIRGSSELAGGVSGSYFTRLEHTNRTTHTSTGPENTLDAVRANYTLSGDFGSLTVGRNTDLVYNLVTGRTDVAYGNEAVVPGVAASAGTTDSDDVSFQYSNSAGPFGFAAYVDTAKADTTGNNGKDTEDGINNTQLGVTYDFGMGSAGIVYATSEDSGTEDVLAAGATLNLDFASLRGHVVQNADDNSPVTLFADIPLTEMVTGYVAYGDPDTTGGSSESMIGARANLGGGFVTYAEYITGGAVGSGDGSAYWVGGQYSF